MKLIGNLKKKVENAKTKEEARDTIKKAGMLLDDDELEQVSGGGSNLLEDLWYPGFRVGNKVTYVGNNERFYGEKGTIIDILRDRIIPENSYTVEFGREGQLKCTESDLQKTV